MLKPLKSKVQETKNSFISLEEEARLKELHFYENAAFQKGFHTIAGVDEAGRGPLAGPVVAAACIIPKNILFPGVNDSKKLTRNQRKDLFQQITSHKNVIYGVGIVSHEIIDQINIYQATIQAMQIAVSSLNIKPDFILVDGVALSITDIVSQKIIKGDQLSHMIAAASIIAKETRDQLMETYHQKWPEYGFDSHKGYGTSKHLLALDQHGPCPIHRLSFAPVQKKSL